MLQDQIAFSDNEISAGRVDPMGEYGNYIRGLNSDLCGQIAEVIFSSDPNNSIV